MKVSSVLFRKMEQAGLFTYDAQSDKFRPTRKFIEQTLNANRANGPYVKQKTYDRMINTTEKLQSKESLDSLADELKRRGVSWRESNEILKAKIRDYNEAYYWYLTNAHLEYLREKMKS